jgi:hypothetical protein
LGFEGAEVVEADFVPRKKGDRGIGKAVESKGNGAENGSESVWIA